MIVKPNSNLYVGHVTKSSKLWHYNDESLSVRMKDFNFDKLYKIYIYTITDPWSPLIYKKLMSLGRGGGGGGGLCVVTGSLEKFIHNFIFRNNIYFTRVP